MSEQDKGFQNIGAKVESKEGERGPLSCNKANVRSPSLELKTDGSEEVETFSNVVLTPKTIDIFSGFAIALKRIHIRLIAEGYIINSEGITKSERLLSYEQDNKPPRKNK